MKTLTIDQVQGKDLPISWAEKAQVRPDEEVSIRILPSRKERTARLQAVIEAVAKNISASGASEEEIKRLITEDEEELKNLFG